MSESVASTSSVPEKETIAKSAAWVQPLRTEIARVLIGQTELVDRLLVALLTNGHVLLEGVPGLAKTLAVRTLSSALHADFKRIQFTPDLLPADVVGTMVYHPKEGTFTPRLGPIFANLVLADEINRAPAKVQSALLEAMQERQVTIGDTSYKLPDPFMVLATQNPIETEGTYPLPEAQVDRFMMKVLIDYPSEDEEFVIVQRVIAGGAKASGVVSLEELQALQIQCRHCYVDPSLVHYAVKLVSATRFPEKYGLESIKGLISFNFLF
jgi:MoxR-like ATPase